MAVLASDTQITKKHDGIYKYPVLAATRIYKGSFVAVTATGYAIPAMDIAGQTFIGVAVENALGGTSSGDVWIKVYTTGEFLFKATPITQAMVGLPMYVQASGQFTPWPTNQCCGTLVEYVDSGYGWIDIHKGLWVAEANATQYGAKFIAANLVTKTASYTVTQADNGKVFACATDAIVFTLPAVAAGLSYTFINTGADTANNVRITPAATDGIGGGGLTGVIAKYLDNTKGTSFFGDYVTIVGIGAAGIGTGGWLITKSQGTWAKEA
jgi:hypothetical protein